MFRNALLIVAAIALMAFASVPVEAGQYKARGYNAPFISGVVASGVSRALNTGRLAQACLSQQQIRQAVSSGQALPLSRLITTIRSTVGGQVLSPAQLCNSGGRLTYHVNVLSGNGQVRAVTIDASSGTILGY